jgi:hypothetical protein
MRRSIGAAMTEKKIPEPFGPNYPRELGTKIASFRRLARRGLDKLTPEQRRAYGNAVHAAFLSRTRSIAKHVEPKGSALCASRTYHSDGNKIAAAIRQQHRSAALAWPAQIRRARSDAEWRDMYRAAMKEKRK